VQQPRKPRNKKLLDVASFRNSMKRLASKKSNTHAGKNADVGWMQMTNDDTGEVYYEHGGTGKISREPPESFSTAAFTRVILPVLLTALVLPVAGSCWS
jgi:hypothetical protein